MGKSSRDKGTRGEREAAQEIFRLFGVSARRGVQFSGGDGSPDIMTAIDGVHFEVKRCEQQRLYDWLKQASDDAGEYGTPVVLSAGGSVLLAY